MCRHSRIPQSAESRKKLSTYGQFEVSKRSILELEDFEESKQLRLDGTRTAWRRQVLHLLLVFVPLDWKVIQLVGLGLVPALCTALTIQFEAGNCSDVVLGLLLKYW